MLADAFASSAVASRIALPAEAAVSRLMRWRAVVPALDAWIGAGATPAAALRRLGLTLWAANDAKGAAEALAEAVAHDPADPAVWLDLGFARHAAHDLAAAREAFESAVRLAPELARGWLALGLAAKPAGDRRQAEAAFERALALAPELDEAAYALGLICFEDRRYAEAARHWRGVVARGGAAPGLRLGLGQCQFFLGEFDAAAVSLAAHLAEAPGDAEVARRLALVRFLDGAIRGGPEGARAAHASSGGDAPLANLAATAVQLLSAYGYAETALAVARAFLADRADDPLHRYHLDALAGARRDRAPADYVAAYFDRFAETFDTQMFEVLRYCGPRKLARLVAETGAPCARTLDLGCGTGAAGAFLRPRAARLEGLDLSVRMLDKARERGLYDALTQADMVEHLVARRDALDLVFAADSLIYLGDLRPLLEAVAQALSPGGVFAATVETASEGFELLSSGRFAHAPKYVISTGAEAGLALRASRRAFLRLEAHRRVYGALIVLERRSHSGRVSAISTRSRRRPSGPR